MDIRYPNLGVHSDDRLKIQRAQNKWLRAITGACRYTLMEDLHRDLQISTINEVAKEYAKKHEKRLHAHPNIEAIQLLDIEQQLRRLKRTKPHELV